MGLINRLRIVSIFVNSINPDIPVKTISEALHEKVTIHAGLIVGYTDCPWRHYLNLDKSIPLIRMPEYNNSLGGGYGEPLEILGGFTKLDQGVIPSFDLLEATNDIAAHQQARIIAFDALDPKIKAHFPPTHDYLTYRTTHGFAYQYSHDLTAYVAIDEQNQSVGYTSFVDFFFHEHVALTRLANCSQDVLSIGGKELRVNFLIETPGKDSYSKKEALKKILPTLIEQEYTRVSLVNIDQGTEEVLHENPHASSVKAYRVLYMQSVPFSSMRKLPLLSDFAGVTGDQSLIEAMSAGNLVSYEFCNHKKAFVEGYLQAVVQETDNPEVHLLAASLMKKIVRASVIRYDFKQISTLLGNKEVVEALMRINRALVEKSTYFEALKNMLHDPTTALKKTFMPIQMVSAADQSKLVQVSKALLDAVNQHEQSSPHWEKRRTAAMAIHALIHTNLEGLSLTDVDNIDKQVKVIKENEPTWHERSLLQEILHIMTGGKIPLMRHDFFRDSTLDETVKIVQELNQRV